MTVELKAPPKGGTNLSNTKIYLPNREVTSLAALLPSFQSFPAHSIHFSTSRKLKSSKMSLKSLYDSYKQSTKYTLAWLWSQIEIKPSESNTSFRNTTEIISAANEIRQRRVPVPASVLSNLSSAIKKRKAVMGLFQGAPREVNASYKAFIEKYVTKRIKPPFRTGLSDWSK